MNVFYINLSTLFICVDVIISIKPVKQVMPIKKTIKRSESGISEVDFNEYPYVVRYEALPPSSDQSDPTRSYKSRHICSGTALSPSSTLTAAFCCAAAGDSSKTVIKFGDMMSEVSKCTLVVSKRGPTHPLMMGDLAVLTTEPVMLKAYGRLSAIDHGTLLGQSVTILGYGLTDDGGSPTNDQEKILPLQRVDGMWSKCSGDVVYPVMCASGTCGAQAPCVIDSGGPVVHDTGIVGVSTLVFTNYKCGQGSRLNTIDFIYPVGGTVDLISSLVADVENKNKHKYFQ